jgi:hypothetical protein
VTVRSSPSINLLSLVMQPAGRPSCQVRPSAHEVGRFSCATCPCGRTQGKSERRG